MVRLMLVALQLLPGRDSRSRSSIEPIVGKLQSKAEKSLPSASFRLETSAPGITDADTTEG